MNKSDKEQINQLDGLNTVWYENGQKKLEFSIKDSFILDGLQTWWYENGEKKVEYNYKDRRFISKKEWNEDGSVKE